MKLLIQAKDILVEYAELKVLDINELEIFDHDRYFLDLPAIEALEEMMKNYKGTIIFISHDKRLIKNTPDVIYEIKGKKIVQIK